ncbi:MAG: diacylglycerol kinase family protein [Thermoguttaceae bacterium]
MASSKHYIVVMNPHGGKRRATAVLESVRPILTAADARLHVHVTTGPGHAAEIAATIDLDGCDGLCVVGGDGTIHEVVGGLMRREEPVRTPLGIIPAGTGNAVMTHLDCCDPLDAARRIVAGEARPLDVVRVATPAGVVYCVNIIGWGAVADINRTAERLRALGTSRYAVAAVLHIVRAKRRRAKLTLDETVFEDDFLFVAACNTKFTGAGMQLAPRAEMGDGKLDVVLVRRASRRQMFRLFGKVFDGSHLDLPYVEYHQVRSFRIESDDGDGLLLDGEFKGNTPLSAEMMPAALRVFV